jgi:hypothetical protein
MKKLILAALALGLLCVASPAIAQEHYTDGPVWRINYLNVKPGKMGDSLKDIRENFAKVSAAAKAQGLILDAKVYLNPTSTGPDDWDIATCVLYKNWAQMDGLTAATEALTLKHYGSAEARTQANNKRLEMWTVTSSNLAREITMR